MGYEENTKEEGETYLQNLLSEVFYLQRSQIIYEMPKLQNVPDKHCSKGKPDKTSLIKNF